VLRLAKHIFSGGHNGLYAVAPALQHLLMPGKKGAYAVRSFLPGTAPVRMPAGYLLPSLAAQAGANGPRIDKKMMIIKALNTGI